MKYSPSGLDVDNETGCEFPSNPELVGLIMQPRALVRGGRARWAFSGRAEQNCGPVDEKVAPGW